MLGNRLFIGIYKLCNWICYFFYLNVMWIVCTLLGGVILGFTPSTIALYTVARKTAMQEEEVPVFKTFWQTYKAEFLKANLLGGILVGVGLIWYFDLLFFRQLEGTVFTILNLLMTIVGVVYIMLLLYIFPIYVHYDMKLFSYIKYAIAFAFLHPLNFAAMLITGLSTYYFLVYFQGFIPLFGVSLLAQLNMWLAYLSFQKVAGTYESQQKRKYEKSPA
ncbi:YesL family protein [Sediminibacillus massiliensis]|uniref:YesL family protein n=1 Tax=Sediminibacillus massiliensis TaxID=1926277 RepID=UPI0009886BB1|nr:YesL family protein [Sediminibacillus massiliensis]